MQIELRQTVAPAPAPAPVYVPGISIEKNTRAHLNMNNINTQFQFLPEQSHPLRLSMFQPQGQVISFLVHLLKCYFDYFMIYIAPVVAPAPSPVIAPGNIEKKRRNVLRPLAILCVQRWEDNDFLPGDPQVIYFGCYQVTTQIKVTQKDLPFFPALGM